MENIINHNSPIPLVRQIYFHIRQKIITGELVEGEKLSTLTELEKILGVGICTVRKAFNLLAKENLIWRIPHKGTFVQGYSGSTAAEQIALTFEQKTNLRNLNIAIIYDHRIKNNVRISRLIDEFESVISSCNAKTMLIEFQGTIFEHEIQKQKLSLANAIFYICTGFPKEDENIIQCQSLKIPLITSSYLGKLKVSRVNEDWDWAMKELMKHLVELGHRKLALISYSPGEKDSLAYPWGIEREKVFLEVGKQNGFDLDESDIYTGFLQNKNGTNALIANVGAKLGCQIFKSSRKYTAVIGINDSIAAGIITAAKKFRLKIPGDISIAGFDNHAFSLAAGLTTVAHNLAADGRDAAQMLIDLILAPNNSRIIEIKNKPILLVRTSTAPICRHKSTTRRKDLLQVF